MIASTQDSTTHFSWLDVLSQFAPTDGLARLATERVVYTCPCQTHKNGLSPAKAAIGGSTRPHYAAGFVSRNA
jgi:hypothetical protein